MHHRTDVGPCFVDFEVKQNFDEMLSAAGAGKEFVITCHGWPVARLGPLVEAGTQ